MLVNLYDYRYGCAITSRPFTEHTAQAAISALFAMFSRFFVHPNAIRRLFWRDSHVRLSPIAKSKRNQAKYDAETARGDKWSPFEGITFVINRANRSIVLFETGYHITRPRRCSSYGERSLIISRIHSSGTANAIKNIAAFLLAIERPSMEDKVIS